MKNRKAFVGPLGDDIPSIFPIIAGVLLFFSTVYYASSLIDARNEYLEKRKAALDLSYVLTEKGFLSTEDFQVLCDSRLRTAGTTFGVKFIAFVDVEETDCSGIYSPDDTSPEFYRHAAGESFNPAFYSLSLKSLNRIGYCTNLLSTPTTAEAEEIVSKEPVVFNYPISTNCVHEPSLKGVGLLTVMTWH
ncbi:MAG: hypothetical protein V1834_00365 [Candidatus Micrarchaeota archaeon]